MGRLTYSAAARHDLLEIWLNIALDSATVADRVLGRSRPDIGESARALVVSRWLALYRVEPDSVMVVRIIDGVRDLEYREWDR